MIPVDGDIIWTYAIRIAAGFIASIAVIVILLKSKIAQTILDFPNRRSLHKKPVPRIGGLAILCGISVGWLGLSYPHIVVISVAVLLLGLISFLDDLKNLVVWQRFFVHFLAASIGAGCVASEMAWPVILCSVLALVWMTNLYNFMDGADGLAGGMSVVGFSVFAVAAFLKGDHVFGALNSVVAASSLGFLLYNFSPARVFMGDAGSIPLGFLAGLFGLMGWFQGLWPVWFPLIVFSPFIVDASWTLLHRVYRKERFWLPHKKHYYQRLIQMGWGHRKTVLVEYFIMVACSISALIAIFYESGVQWVVILLWLVVYAVLLMWVDRKWHCHKRT